MHIVECEFSIINSAFNWFFDGSERAQICFSYVFAFTLFRCDVCVCLCDAFTAASLFEFHLKLHAHALALTYKFAIPMPN